MGYIVSNIRSPKHVKVGDTIVHSNNTNSVALKGFKDIKPMVFAGIYPTSPSGFEGLRVAMEKLQLNDSSLMWQPETSSALGFGFRCGFLGVLHMEIIQERLDREFKMDGNYYLTFGRISCSY